jgi:stromal membrane-associated protein
MAQQPQSTNVWGGTLAPNTQQNASAFDATSVWGNSAGGAGKPAPGATPAAFDLFATTSSANGGSAGAGNAPKKDDAFGDLWGGFK